MVKYLLIVLLCSGLCTSAQDGFRLADGVDRQTIPFEFISNMIIVPLQVNGTTLSFVLDTGAPHTSILNLTGVDSLSVGDGNRVKVRGYGRMEPMSAIFSEGNILQSDNYQAVNSSIYVLTENQISLVPIIGREVNGIIGADFFWNHVVEIDYIRERLTIYRDISEVPRSRLGRPFSVALKSRKPYITLQLSGDERAESATGLVDTGSGDSLWVFDKPAGLATAQQSFEDYLGLGVSGEVYGTRTKIDELKMGSYSLQDVTTAFPESEALPDELSNNGGTAAIGNEVLRRFRVVVDYRGKKIYLDENEDIRNGFYYNMLGINVKEGEKELIAFAKPVNSSDRRENRAVVKVSPSMADIISYQMVPAVIVNYVNPGSLADRNDIRVGDEIVRVNYKRKGKFSLNDLYTYMYNRPYTVIKLEILREGKTYKKKMRLVPIIER